MAVSVTTAIPHFIAVSPSLYSDLVKWVRIIHPLTRNYNAETRQKPVQPLTVRARAQVRLEHARPTHGNVFTRATRKGDEKP